MVSQPVFQLRIQLDGVTPTVWRRIIVPGAVQLSKLHQMFQAAMGWTDSYLHAFTIDGQRYCNYFDGWPDEDEELDGKDFTVSMVLRGGVRRFRYEYDFGDSWEHTVTVEEGTHISSGLKFAVCIDGQNACPPEDVGGIPGYAGFLEAIADPDHGEHDDYLVWVGYKFDPSAFSLAEANNALQHVR